MKERLNRKTGEWVKIKETFEDYVDDMENNALTVTVLGNHHVKVEPEFDLSHPGWIFTSKQALVDFFRSGQQLSMKDRGLIR